MGLLADTRGERCNTDLGMDPKLAKDVMIGVVLFGAFVLVPIIMALLSHQQKMTQMLSKSNDEAEQLRSALQRVEQKLDALSPAPASQPTPPEPSVRQTLGR